MLCMPTSSSRPPWTVQRRHHRVRACRSAEVRFRPTPSHTSIEAKQHPLVHRRALASTLAEWLSGWVFRATASPLDTRASTIWSMITTNATTSEAGAVSFSAGRKNRCGVYWNRCPATSAPTSPASRRPPPSRSPALPSSSTASRKLSPSKKAHAPCGLPSTRPSIPTAGCRKLQTSSRRSATSKRSARRGTLFLRG